jgi:HK97 family phage prohead protease
MNYLSPNEFKTIAKTNKTNMHGITKQYVNVPSNLGERQVKFTISTNAIDRDKDKVNQKGWDLLNYLKNPVVLFGHDAKSLPVGKCVQIGLEDGEQKATVEFVNKDIPIAGPMSEAVYQLCVGGFLSATSVGFRPLEWEFSTEKDRGADTYQGGVDFNKQELMEFSIVPIPANPEALIAEVNTEDLTDSDKALNNFNRSKDQMLLKVRLIELNNLSQ